MNQFLRISWLLLIACLCTSRLVSAAPMTLDWSDWDASWNAGDLGPQTLVIGAEQTVTYQGFTDVDTVFLSGTPDVLIDSPPSFAFNGTGGAADHYLDLYQSNNIPGTGSSHVFSFSTPVTQLSLVIWDIDANNASDNYVDLVRVFAELSGGAMVAPTSSQINDPTFVKMVSADTWSGIPFLTSDDDSDTGNLSLTFGYSGITSLTIEYLNSTESTIPDQPSGGHAIGIYNMSFLPEPNLSLWMTLLLIPFMRSRRPDSV